MLILIINIISQARNHNSYGINYDSDNFSDNNEARLFIDMLCDLRREVKKNIWVLHTGNYTDYSMERGIKYLGINNNTTDAFEIGSNTNCILITVNGKNLTYEIKNVFDQQKSDC